jgi:hypothetical protein
VRGKPRAKRKSVAEFLMSAAKLRGRRSTRVSLSERTAQPSTCRCDCVRTGRSGAMRRFDEPRAGDRRRWQRSSRRAFALTRKSPNRRRRRRASATQVPRVAEAMSVRFGIGTVPSGASKRPRSDLRGRCKTLASRMRGSYSAGTKVQSAPSYLAAHRARPQVWPTRLLPKP